MKFHQELILVRSIMGCISPLTGCCHGFAIRWLEACFLGDEYSFHERAKHIHYYAENIPTMLSDKELLKTKSNEKLYDLMGFLDSITLYQNPHLYHSLFKPKGGISQNYIELISKIAGSDPIRDLGGLVHQFKQSHFFTKKELYSYLYQLTVLLIDSDLTSENRIGFLISSHNHSMALVYKPNEYWQLMDINQYPAKVFTFQQLNSLCNTVFKGLCNWRQPQFGIGFHLDLFTVEKEVLPEKLYGNLQYLKEKFPVTFLEVSRKTADGTDLAYIAAQHGDLECIEVLKTFKINLHKLTHLGTTPIYMAAQNGYHHIISQLNSPDLEIDYTYEQNETALFVAARNGHYKCVIELIKLGANPHLMAFNGMSALQIAVFFNHVETVKVLIKNKVDILRCYPHSILETFKKYEEDGPIPSRLKGLLQDESSDVATPRQIASILGHKDLEALLCSAEEQTVLKP